jgi:hypothetical protein
MMGRRMTGNSRTPEYKAFIAARGRCLNPDDAGYKYYGGRGIEFHLQSHQQIINALGPRPEGMTLDRIDNNKHYCVGCPKCPENNLRWATYSQQLRNRRPWQKNYISQSDDVPAPSRFERDVIITCTMQRGLTRHQASKLFGLGYWAIRDVARETRRKIEATMHSHGVQDFRWRVTKE